jgi:hypothetical protein
MYEQICKHCRNKIVEGFDIEELTIQTGEWRKLNTARLHDFHSSQNIIRVFR